MPQSLIKKCLAVDVFIKIIVIIFVITIAKNTLIPLMCSICFVIYSTDGAPHGVDIHSI